MTSSKIMSLPGIMVVLVFAVFFIFMCIPIPDKSYNPIELAADDTDCSPSKEAYAPIIHQIWLNYTAFPREWAAPIEHCKLMNADHKYILWSAKLLENFLLEHYKWFLPTYKSYKHNVQRTDAARLFLLYHYGGVYLDMDINCVRPFTNITSELRRYDVILSRGTTFGVSNHIMVVKPRHPYLKLSIDSLIDHNRWLVLPYITIMYTAGPGFLTVMLREYACKRQVHVLPPEPYHNRYYINLHGGSWHTWDTYLIDGLGAVHKAIRHSLSWTVFVLAILAALVVFFIGRYAYRIHINTLY